MAAYTDMMVAESAAGGASFSLYARKDTETTGLDKGTRSGSQKEASSFCSRDMFELGILESWTRFLEIQQPSKICWHESR
jgi:hypothetical protein